MPIEPERVDGQEYHFTEDMTDRAIEWIGQQKALSPDKPFFAYFAPGATHAPHHVPKECADRYAGRFDAGWDALREETVERQRQSGVIPADAELTARPEEIPAWDDMPDDLKPVLARQMEVYAGFLEHTDHHIGRLIDSLAELGVLDDTLVYVIIGDNGASAEGTINGTFNEAITLNGASALETVEFMSSRIDDFGTPRANNHYAVGWAHAMNTPYQWTKQVASHWGGTRNGAIVHWPNGITAKGEIRTQFTHVIDVAPTILEAAHLPHPTFVHGIQQAALEGVSMLYAFDEAGAAERHETQYFEMFVNRGIYHQGWTAVTRHSTPWKSGEQLPALDDDVWELYSPDDWTQARNVAAEHPDRLRYLQRLFLIEAAKYNVFPLDDRKFERFNADLAGRPQLIKGNTQLLFGGMGRLSENSVINLKNKSHAVTADLTVRTAGAGGVIVAQGGRFGGWVLYVHDGKPAYCYNLLGVQQFKVHADTDLTPGDHQVRMEFDYDGGGLGQGRHGQPLHRRQPRRPGTGRGHPADDLLRRRDHRRRQRHRHPGQRRLHTRRAAPSKVESGGCRSTSTTPPRTPTTSSPPRSNTASPSPGSNGRGITTPCGPKPVTAHAQRHDRADRGRSGRSPGHDNARHGGGTRAGVDSEGEARQGPGNWRASLPECCFTRLSKP